MTKSHSKELRLNLGLTAPIASNLDNSDIERLKNQPIAFSMVVPAPSPRRPGEMSIASLQSRVQRRHRGRDTEVRLHVSGQTIIQMERVFLSPGSDPLSSVEGQSDRCDTG